MKRSIRPPKRAGVAPLELVMGLPFLFAVFAMLLSLGYVSLRKGMVTADVRREVWKLRDPDQQGSGITNKEGPQSYVPMAVIPPPSSDEGMVYGEVQGSVRVFSRGGGSVSPTSGTAVLIGSWDHREIDDFNDRGPHLEIIERILGSDMGLSGPISDLIGLLLNADIELSNQGEIDGAQEEYEENKEEAERRHQELEDEVTRLEEELAELRRERQDLVDEKNRKQDEKRDKEDELDDLKDIDPRTPEVQQQIDQLEDEIDQLEDDIDQLDDDIRDKDIEIDAKEQELEDAREALDAANEELDNLPDLP